MPTSGSKQGEHVFNDLGALASESAARLRSAVPRDAVVGEKIGVAELLARLDQQGRAFAEGRDHVGFGRAAGGRGDPANAAAYGEFAQSTRNGITQMLSRDPARFELGRQQLYDNLARIEAAAIDEVAQRAAIAELPRNQQAAARQWFARVGEEARRLYASLIAGVETIARTGKGNAQALGGVRPSTVAARPTIRLRAIGPLNLLSTLVGYFADAKEAKNPEAVRAYADAVLRGEMPIEALYLSPLFEPVLAELQRRQWEA